MKKHTLLIIIAFFSIYVFWGSTFLWNKMAVAELSPLFLSGIRFTTAGVLIFIIAKVMGKSLKLSLKQFGNCVLVGFLFLVYGNGLFVWSLQYIDSGFAALLASLQPLFIMLLMFLFLGKRFKTKSLIGIALGVLGMYLLVSQKTLSFQDGTAWGIIVIISCVLSWSIGSVFVSKADLPKNFFINTGYQMFTGGLLMLGSSALIGETWKSPIDWTFKTQVLLIALILFGSIAAFTSFNYLLKNVSTEKVATSGYVNPIIAVFLGWFFLDEIVTLQTIIAGIILFIGVYFINSSKTKKFV